MEASNKKVINGNEAKRLVMAEEGEDTSAATQGKPRDRRIELQGSITIQKSEM